ncbi:P22 phage major capsid protein family protein [Phaeobacter piscinae]|uniref:P22 phage major capsid protein family protein n=1 Tax=Phaeobacter piscinae TaxID=1580596 RepID=UPI000C9C3A42|nr:P22 phage major capsid protein family protein [Phaeobacter piscinae]AUQ74763.1 P22 coat protein [Phaeobacter piscinae]
MANDFYTTDKILKEAIMLLENELVMGNAVHTDLQGQAPGGAEKVGNTISIRRPTQYQGQADDIDITGYREDIEQATIPITLDKTHTVPVQIGALERTFDFNRFSEDILKPAMITMKDRVEAHIASKYSDFYHFSGTPGTVPSTFKDLGRVGAILTDGAVSNSGRVAFHGTDASLELADGLKGVYVQGKAKTAFEEATIGRYGGFTNYQTVYAPTHTVGNHGGTPLVNGASQNVTYAAAKQSFSSPLVTDGWSASRTGLLKKGDVITIAGVNAVNPVSKEDTGRLQTFVVKADVNSDGSGNATVQLSPPLVTSGAYQTVSAAPADNAAITVKTGSANGVHKQSLLLNPKAIALVTRPLDIPNGSGVKTTTKSGEKVTISCTEFVDGNTLAQTFRFDILYKAETVDARLGARLTS